MRTPSEKHTEPIEHAFLFNRNPQLPYPVFDIFHL